MTASGVGQTRRIVLALSALSLLTVLLLPTGAPRAGGEPGAPEFLTVRVDSVTPDVVTTSSEPTVTVTGTVTNVGDRPVRDVVARLERAPAVATTTELRTSLAGNATEFQPVGEFIPVTTELERGKAAGFRFSFPLRSGPQTSLNIDAPGVYPLLVNVNGTPDFGAPARLDARRFLLPVTGVPGAGTSGDTLADIVTPDTTKPVTVTLLWPLADKPRLAPGQPGGTSPVRLMNDDLAVSLVAGGRLDSLLSAAEFAASPGAIAPGVDQSLCLAVDPDLLVTVNAMAAGYAVADAPDGLGTAAHPGAGQAAAVAWLDRLRGLARRLCVTATPYAQADLGALHRVGDRSLATAATTGADIVDGILGVASTRGATILGDGPLTDTAFDLLDRQGATVALAPAADPAAVARRLSARVTVAPFDPALGAALAGVGTNPEVPGYLDAALSVALDRDSPVARRQDAVAALLWKMLRPDTEPRTEILVPPMTWSPQPDDARAILTALANAVRSGLATPRPLAAVIADTAAVTGEADGTPGRSTLPAEEAGRFHDDVVATIAVEVGRLAGLGAALTTDPQTGLTGPQYTAPLREDMLRALSQTEPPGSRNDIARPRLAVVGATVEDLFRAVTIVNPSDSYTLAAERSALPLALRNDLAVPIRVRLQVDAPPGMSVTDIGEQELPPGYLPLRVPVEVRITQRVAVDVTLRTPQGLQLGVPVRLSVHSNAYGKVLFAITLGGAVVLALLVGRRLYHRFRGQPDRADLDRPLDPPRQPDDA